MYLASCNNTHHDVTDFVNLGIVKNTKTWISWEWNITFLRNKGILNMCLRWYILRGYCFVAEVTFKEDGLNWSVLVYLFVIFIPLSYCFEETTRFDVKALLTRGPLSRLIKPCDITKKNWGKGYSVPRDFSWIENC